MTIKNTQQPVTKYYGENFERVFPCNHSQVVWDPDEQKCVCLACGKEGKNPEEVRNAD